ncbi:Glycosyltransferase involved in cell wall bisynthesis [Pedobacter terrae]|uniref:Glycosyltransferase involved in cell wall bisynthesis n=1 Tax=Pedobacter terrae TaxID=405671 RepID=A0A1G7TXJ7_9SPHI|nr:glycosyltransferase [Pedobacter terrae]SDG39479.1 Glycosyltransferase involved in cell wall bisynthesis [Pedobacter terrae]
MEPLVSIVTPCYNSAAFITETLDAVVAQRYTNWELIVVDDRSADETCDIVEAFASRHPRVRLVALKENGGVSNARNIGLAEAKGKYIAFLDSDDIWLEDKLSRQVSYMEKELLPLTFCAYNRIDEQGKIISGQIPVPRTVNYNALLAHNVVIFSTSMMLKSAIGDIKFSRAGHEDWIFLLQLLKKCGQGYGINQPLVYYRVRQNSVSSNKLKAIGYTWKIFRESEGINFFRSAILLGRYAVSASLKRLR